MTHWLVNGLDVLYFIGIGVTDCVAWQRFGLTYGRPACQAGTKASAGHWHRLFIRGGNPDIVTEVDNKWILAWLLIYYAVILTMLCDTSTINEGKFKLNIDFKEVEKKNLLKTSTRQIYTSVGIFNVQKKYEVFKNCHI